MGRFSVIGACVLLLCLFLGINMVSLNAFRGIKVDATANSMFTLTKGSRNIARTLPEKVRLKLYFSKKVAQGRPEFLTYGDRVREMLEEFVGASGGKLELKVIEPLAFSEAEDEANQAGLQGGRLGARGETFFLGLVVEGPTDERQVIPFFDPSKEAFLEYDIAKAIYAVGQSEKPVVGLISSLPLEGGMTMDPRTRQPRQSPPWRIMSEIEGIATVNNLGTTVTSIPADVDVLWIIHPKNLTDQTLYAIDQFVLKGGHAIVQVDPNCDADPEASPMNPGASKISELNKVLNAWGVSVPIDTIAADEESALPVNTRDSGGMPVPFVAWLRLLEASMDRDDPITAQLSVLHFPTSGFILSVPTSTPAADGPPAPDAAAGPRAQIAPLVTTSATAMKMSASALGFQPDPKALLAQFVPGTEKLTLAARLSGKVRSAFPNGRPLAEGETPPEKDESLKESAGSINVVLVADVDMLSDMFWSRQEELFGQIIGYSKIAANGDMVTNAIDNLLGSSDLISIRARETSIRPFTRVEDLRTRAAKDLLKQEEEIEAQIASTERELSQLQAARGENADAFVLTPDQQKAVDNLETKLLEARREKRRLRLALNKDIESLATRLKLVNLGMMPAAVTLLAVGVSVVRQSRRSRSRV
jgi:ABC-type uncharacterized transport system involved in gliding motility auxiliary subunit